MPDPKPRSEVIETTREGVRNGTRIHSGRNTTIIVRRDGFVRCRWSTLQGRVGDQVELIAELAPGATISTATFRIFERDKATEDDVVTVLPGQVQGQNMRATWRVQNIAEEAAERAEGNSDGRRWELPEFYFRVEAGEKRADSGRADNRLLKIVDRVDRPVTGFDGKPLPGASYEMELADGSTRRGTLDERSRVREEEVPAGRFKLRVELPNPLRTRRPANLLDKLKPLRPMRWGRPDAAIRRAALGKQPLRLRGLGFDRPFALSGATVRLWAQLDGGGSEGLSFLIKKKGSEATVATVPASLRDSKLSGQWVVSGASGETASGHPCADFVVQLEVAGQRLVPDKACRAMRAYTIENRES